MGRDRKGLSRSIAKSVCGLDTTTSYGLRWRMSIPRPADRLVRQLFGRLGRGGLSYSTPHLTVRYIGPVSFQFEVVVVKGLGSKRVMFSGPAHPRKNNNHELSSLITRAEERYSWANTWQLFPALGKLPLNRQKVPAIASPMLGNPLVRRS
jgi:hypothetical protein